MEEHLICEDHFLPEDICKKGVKGDAIPIMPPCPDGSLDMITRWGAESADEEEEAPWAEEEEMDAVDGLDGGLFRAVEPPAVKRFTNRTQNLSRCIS